jgi:hypothetical protein
MVNWITVVYVLAVCVYRCYMRSLGRLMCNTVHTIAVHSVSLLGMKFCFTVGCNVYIVN